MTSTLKKLGNVRFEIVNSLRGVPDHLTHTYFVDEAISHKVNAASFFGLDPNEKLKIDERDSIILDSTLL